MVIQSRFSPPDWTDDEGGGTDGARCRLFEVTRDDDGRVRNDTWFQDAEQALPICNGDYIGSPCPMRASCLMAALVNNEQRGVWGGMTGPQRRWIRRNISQDDWGKGDAWIREQVPPPDYFKDLGDGDPEEDYEEE